MKIGERKMTDDKYAGVAKDFKVIAGEDLTDCRNKPVRIVDGKVMRRTLPGPEQHVVGFSFTLRNAPAKGGEAIVRVMTRKELLDKFVIGAPSGAPVRGNAAEQFSVKIAEKMKKNPGMSYSAAFTQVQIDEPGIAAQITNRL